ncbi:MAG: protoporphyrinogen oxidase HemJ [Alphaproteobacteria bacterium]|nr:protoporphyrinogen oxidase HemJ [Alphaproteobacteria bacterium]
MALSLADAPQSCSSYNTFLPIFLLTYMNPMTNPMNYYDLIKALHIIAMVAWMAGMLYLPRLFVYHVDAKAGSELSETLKLMERRLLKFIMNPAMMATFIFGIALIALQPVYLQTGWLYVKLALVLVMSGVHGFYAASLRRFANDQNTRSSKFWRIMNEVPTVLMIGIILLVVLRPF